MEVKEKVHEIEKATINIRTLSEMLEQGEKTIALLKGEL